MGTAYAQQIKQKGRCAPRFAVGLVPFDTPAVRCLTRLHASDGAATTTAVAWTAALVIAGAMVIAVFVGEDRGWGAGMTFAVVGIVAVPVAAAFVVWERVRGNRRAQGFTAAATKMGARIAPDEAPRLLAMPFRLFRIGRGREVQNVAMRQSGEHEVWIIDLLYWRETYNPKTLSTNRVDYEHTCAIVELPRPLPSLIVGREGFWSRIARAIGIDDVEIGDETFDRFFKVKSQDPPAARALLQQDLRFWLLSLDPRWSFETAGNYVLAFAGRLPLYQLSFAEQAVIGFVNRLPDDVAAP